MLAIQVLLSLISAAILAVAILRLIQYWKSAGTLIWTIVQTCTVLEGMSCLGTHPISRGATTNRNVNRFLTEQFALFIGVSILLAAELSIPILCTSSC